MENIKEMIGIGERLIKVRAEIGLKQGEFADRIGISQGMLSDIEHENKPLTERNIKLIHLTFGVNREWLITGQGEMFNHPINPPLSLDGNNRLKEVRIKLSINQGEFSKGLGISQAQLSAIEHGKQSLTDRNIKVVCMVYRVNEHWLRTGEGEMFAPLESKYIAEDDINSLPPDEKAFLLDYRLLTAPNKKVAKTMVKSLLASQAEIEAGHEKKITVIQIFEKVGERQSFL
ncbi:MAG: helix-turn-helix domain-containing protein [Treponema sp.]|jgi:transcriptional regulator with XRE-family HTH domain|nr:helix-turn-helix domain-containing protein [Treponema sp.]